MKMAESKGTKISSLLISLIKRICEQLQRGLFRYQAKNGMLLNLEEGEEELTAEEIEAKRIADEEAQAQADADEQARLDAEAAGGAGEDDEVVVTIGEESPASEDDATAPEWVKDLRKQQRELSRENRELKEKLKAVEPAAVKPVEVGTKPTLEACDFDPEKFEKELDSWHAKKREADEQEQNRKNAETAAQAEWQKTLDGYGKAKTELKVKDFEDAEEIVKDVLTVTQQGIILQGAKNSALVIYALGKNPKTAKQYASIKDPVKFAFAIAELQKDLKVIKRKAATSPEGTVRGNARVSGTVDSQLERLRTDAEKSGDYSKVHAYKKQLRDKAKQT